MLRLTGLVGILLFSFWIGMSPHWNYPYPLHVDEWFAIGYSQSTVHAGSLEFANPYRQNEISFHPEMGFHLVLGFLKTTTGLSWMSLYRFAPGLLMAGLAFVTYAFGRRAGFGWAAALFVSLIPTSSRILGPSFAVPVTAAMLFIPVTLLVLHGMGERGREKSLWLLTLLMLGTIFIHPPTEVAITVLAVLYLVGFLGEALVRRRYGEGLKLLLGVVLRVSIPALILGLWLPTLSQNALQQINVGISGSASSSESESISSGADEARPAGDGQAVSPGSREPGSSGADQAVSPDAPDAESAETPIIESPLGIHTGFVGAFGILAVAVFVFGLFVFIARGDFGVRSYMLTVFTGLILAFLVYLYPDYQFGPDILYRRAWLYLGLLMVIFAGYGVAFYFRSVPAIARAVESRLRWTNSAWTSVAMWAGGAAIVVMMLVTGIMTNGRRDSYSDYYHVVNEPIFADFRWIGGHTAPEQLVAMGEPSIAWAYSPIVGAGTAAFEAAASPWTTPTAEKAREMMSVGEADTLWLRQNGISVFYTCLPITFGCEELTNTDLFKVSNGVYLVPDFPK